MEGINSKHFTNVIELFHKMASHIRSPTDEGTHFFREVIGDIEESLHSLKSHKVKPAKPEDPDVIKNPRGRPRVPHRALLEKGKYDTRPLDPEYQKKYYLEKLKDVKIPCPACGVPMFKVNITRHMKSNKCRCKAEANCIVDDTL